MDGWISWCDEGLCHNDCDLFCSLTADVNFASELSDLRHRHGFQVVLVHGNHTSSALLQHAHRHVSFQEMTADLPPRMLVKSQVSLKMLPPAVFF